MPQILTDETIRRRDVRVKLSWSDIEGMLGRRAMEAVGLGSTDGATIEVKMAQETRGSPSYNVGEWSAVVKVTLPVE